MLFRSIDEAQALYMKTLAGQRRVLGLQHTHTLITMYNIGYLHLRRGRFAEAESTLRATLALDRRVRGERHPSTLETEYTVACVLARAGKRTEALGELRQIVDWGFAGADVAADSDLVSLHGDPEFGTIAAEVQHRRSAK